MFLFLFDVKRIRAIDGSFPLFFSVCSCVFFRRVVAVFCVLDFIFAIHIQ